MLITGLFILIRPTTHWNQSTCFTIPRKKKVMLNLSKSKNGMLKPKDKNTFLLKKRKTPELKTCGFTMLFVFYFPIFCVLFVGCLIGWWTMQEKTPTQAVLTRTRAHPTSSGHAPTHQHHLQPLRTNLGRYFGSLWGNLERLITSNSTPLSSLYSTRCQLGMHRAFLPVPNFGSFFHLLLL